MRRIHILMLIIFINTYSITMGEVFVRWKGLFDLNTAYSSIGLKNIYKADVDINGYSASINVFAGSEPLSTLKKRIPKLFGNPIKFEVSNNMCIAFFKTENTVLRLIGLSLSPNKSIFINIKQSIESYNHSISDTPKHLIKLPQFPNSTPVLYIKNKNTSLEFETLSSNADAYTIYTYYDSILKTKNWANMFKDSISTRIYIKKGEFCCIFVANNNNISTITLLHKKIMVK